MEVFSGHRSFYRDGWSEENWEWGTRYGEGMETSCVTWKRKKERGKNWARFGGGKEKRKLAIHDDMFIFQFSEIVKMYAPIYIHLTSKDGFTSSTLECPLYRDTYS